MYHAAKDRIQTNKQTNKNVQFSSVERSKTTLHYVLDECLLFILLTTLRNLVRSSVQLYSNLFTF
jgi:hypothetical protein